MRGDLQPQDAAPLPPWLPFCWAEYPTVCAGRLLCINMMCKMFINNGKSQNPPSLYVPNLGPRLHPLYGIGGVQFAISRGPVYTAISILNSCSQRFRVVVNSTS